jgi:hypothetical protein
MAACESPKRLMRFLNSAESAVMEVDMVLLTELQQKLLCGLKTGSGL